MSHSPFSSPRTRPGKWLPLRKTRRGGAMAQPLRAQARSLPTKVFCDPRMPDGWVAVSD